VVPIVTHFLAGNSLYLLINLERSFINSLSHCQQYSVSLVEKTKLPFVSKNAPLSRGRECSSSLFRYLKESNPFLSIILPSCMGHCPLNVLCQRLRGLMVLSNPSFILLFGFDEGIFI
jgi:hypothetical protein